MNSLPKKTASQLKQLPWGCFFWILFVPAFLLGGCGVFSFMATHVDCVGGYLILAGAMAILALAGKRGWRLEF